jgi:SAM-dependent methyltransferase
MNLDDMIPNPTYRMGHARAVGAPRSVVWDELHRVTIPVLFSERPDVVISAGLSQAWRLRRRGRAGLTGAVTGLDLSSEMLAITARLSPGVRWQQGSAEALPFADGSFDAVVSQFGLMFFPDPVAGLREMMRVLVPGGRLAVAVWASLADTPAYAAEVELVERLAGKEAGDALRAPFVLGDPRRMAELCAAAGIKEARVAMQPGRGRFPSIRTMVEVDVRDWLQIVGITLDEGLIETILQESETALRPFVTVDGDGVGFDSPAVLATATR